MGKFLRENWIWIVVPIVVVAILLTLFAWFAMDNDPTAPFMYNF